MKFAELLREGKVSIDDMDDFVDAWHDAYTYGHDGGEKKDYIRLHEFLGLTEAEYSRWIETGKIYL